HFVIAIAIHRVEPFAVHGHTRTAKRHGTLPQHLGSALRPDRRDGSPRHLKITIRAGPLPPLGIRSKYEPSEQYQAKHGTAGHELLAYRIGEREDVGGSNYLAPNMFKSRKAMSNPGTSVMTNSTGKMKITMGNSILMPAFPTAASTRKRRRVRKA